MHFLSSLIAPRPLARLADGESGARRGHGVALLALLSLALLAALTLGAGVAGASFPGSNGRIACSGPLGPVPPPAGGSFLEIFTMDGSGAIGPNGAPTSQIRLTNNTNSDFNPRYSADGTKITWIQDNNVWKMNADGTGQTQLTNTGRNTESFVGGWSPDGSKIVFQSSRDGNFEVYTMNADGTNQTNLTNNATPGRNNDSQPSWSPDGTKIAFQSNQSGTSNNIHVMNADGSNPRALTADSLAEESAPEWSPDGQQIAFQSDRGFVPRPDAAGGSGRNLEIHRMNADGSNVTRLTFNDYNPAASGGLTSGNLSGFDLNPHWSPQGDRIVFHSGRAIEFGAAQWDAFTVNAVVGEGPMGSPALRLTARDLNDERCGWGAATPWPLLSVTKAGSGEGTVTSAPAGIDCGTTPTSRDCAQGYAPNTVVTLTAAPAAGGSTFAGWSGAGCSGTGTCVVTMDAAKTVTATFTDPNPALTVTKAGTGVGTVTSVPAGINCGADCTEEYASGTSVTLTAAPAAGSTFAGFTGAGCSGSGTTCTVTVDAAKTVTATFSGPLLTVVKAGDGVGTVTSNPLGINCGPPPFSINDCSEDYAANTMVTLTATVSTVNTAGGAGSTFAGFSGGGCTGTGLTCTVTMDQAKTVTATFVDFPTLTVTKAGAGTGTVTSTAGGLNCGTICTRDFPKDSSVTLTAAPAAGSGFSGFTGGGCTGTGTTCTVTMDQAKTVTATFFVSRTLTVTKAGAGAGTVTSVPAGINCGADCTEAYADGTLVTLTAAPAAGANTFTGFTGGGCSGTGLTCTVTMDAAKTVTATFVQTNVLTVNKAGTGAGTVTSVPPGIDCGADCSESYNSGTSVTLTANPAAGSNFTGFTGAGCTGTGTTCTVTVDQARSVTATFTLIPRALTVTKAGNGSGTVTSQPAGIDCGSDCAQDYGNGTSVTLTANPAAGSSFAGFTGAGCSGTGTTCTVTMDQARSVTATFTLIPRTLTVTKAGNGSGTVTSTPAGIDCGSDCVQQYNHGTVVALTARAASGSVFAGFSGAGCSGYYTGATCRVTMDQARTLTATFVRIPVQPPPGGGGTPAFAGCPSGTTNVILGTPGADVRTGTLAGDRIFTGAGNDRVDARAGNDCVDLGAGADRGQGGAGRDLMLGASGGDRLAGGSGVDSIRGGSGGDVVSGGSSGDRISGQSGNDRINGNSGGDRISGGSGNDRISARDGRRDRINCGSGRRDRVTADRIDRVARNCERVVRRRS